MNDIADLIKTIAKTAVEQDKPASVVTGKVISKNNFKIETEQKLIINEDFIIFPKRFYNYDWEENDNVVLIRCDGGQRYLLVDLMVV